MKKKAIKNSAKGTSPLKPVAATAKKAEKKDAIPAVPSTSADKAAAILKKLNGVYGHKQVGLEFHNPLELLISTILSAQCTDERVNKVTPALFARFKTAKDFAGADQAELEEYIRSTGFFHSKAKSILGAAKAIVEKFGGTVPQTLEELVTLPGVGRKTANVVMAYAFHNPVGVVVDTHVGRLSQRLGFTKQTDPEKIEQDLMQLFPKKDWNKLDNCLIWHGRATCISRKPNCPECIVNDVCPSAPFFLAEYEKLEDQKSKKKSR